MLGLTLPACIPPISISPGPLSISPGPLLQGATTTWCQQLWSDARPAGNSYKDCGHPCETNAVHLRDSQGKDHLVLADMGCRNTVFNAKAQSGLPYLREFLRSGPARCTAFGIDHSYAVHYCDWFLAFLLLEQAHHIALKAHITAHEPHPLSLLLYPAYHPQAFKKPSLYFEHFRRHGLQNFRIELVDEPAEQVVPLLQGYRDVLQGNRDAKDLWSSMKDLTDANGNAHGVATGSLEARRERAAVSLRPSARR